jgi:hypothetical protein
MPTTGLIELSHPDRGKMLRAAFIVALGLVTSDSINIELSKI